MPTQLLNTLYVQTQGTYLRLEGETLCADVEGERRAHVPLHHLGGLVVFGNVLISPFLLARCARDGRSVVWLSRSGRFEGRLSGPVSGNVLLRRAQHEALDGDEWTTEIARSIVRGKVRAQRMVLARAARKADDADLRVAAQSLADLSEQARHVATVAVLRGIEGQAAAVYFAHFDALLHADGFSFETRSRRPPLDPVNALLSFLYTLLTRECEAALESVGLDPQVGFLHVLRPGRPALALDLVEELRPWWADRLALRLLNRGQLTASDFEPRPGGAVYLSETGRKTVLTAHQERKQETVRHRLFEHPIPAGLIPFVQARLLARHLRGDLDSYPPFRTR
jgi:CRISPR-associated protein Cas1